MMASLYMRLTRNRFTRKLLHFNEQNFRTDTMKYSFDFAARIKERELLVKMDTQSNPFDLKVVARGPGTRDTPNQIPSAFDQRLVGCICDQEAKAINWMWLQKGEAKKCGCGYWFNLVQKAPF